MYRFFEVLLVGLFIALLGTVVLWKVSRTKAPPEADKNAKVKKIYDEDPEITVGEGQEFPKLKKTQNN